MGGGDSGGPALVRAADGWELAGVTSRADERDDAPGYSISTSIFVDVALHAPWIRETIGG